MVIGNFEGKLTPVTVMLRVTNIEENTKQKHPQTHEESHYSLHTVTHPVPWTQTYTINHNTASSWDYSNQPHCSTYKLLSIMRATILMAPINFESVWPLHWNQTESPNFLIYKLFLLKWMILEYIPLSHSESTTCKYRREDTMRIKSHRCTVFGSLGDSSWWGTVVKSREPITVRAHMLRMKGKTFAWRMELPSSFRLEIAEFFS